MMGLVALLVGALGMALALFGFVVLGVALAGVAGVCAAEWEING